MVILKYSCLCEGTNNLVLNASSNPCNVIKGTFQIKIYVLFNQNKLLLLLKILKIYLQLKCNIYIERLKLIERLKPVNKKGRI